jgi:hypothetical protein
VSRPTWSRRAPEAREDLWAGLTAFAAACLAGGLTFYVTRAMLARTPLALEPGPASPAEAEERAEEEPR